MIDIAMIAAGLGLLFWGGEWLIKGAVALASRFGLSQLLVSAVIIGFGTSMPEMTVSVGAAIKGASEIALGNIVGSNIANILLIIGLSCILYPITINRQAIKHDAFMMTFAAMILCGLSFTGIVNFIAGFLMLVLLIAYIVFSYHKDSRQQTASPHAAASPHAPPIQSAAFCLSGLLLLVTGAWLMVEGAVAVARDFNISEAVIGLTVVAVGTSLPELATSIIAARKRNSDVIIGNIVGSNIFNILAILGVTAMISPIPIFGQIAHIDLWVMLGATLLLCAYFIRGKSIGPLSGVIMLSAYVAYTIWLYINPQ